MLKFFSHIEIVNAALQKSQLHLQKAKQMVDTLREDNHLGKTLSKQNLESPTVPKPRKIPRRLEDGGALSHSFQITRSNTSRSCIQQSSLLPAT